MEHNVSIIVFSKGRPMQLHAYLESLLLFSDARQEDITVLCCETEGIHYQKVRERFAQVHWQIEKRFEDDLKQAVAEAETYLMFGCDDVVFTRTFSLKKAADYLEKFPEVFGYSMRLGENIEPIPADAVRKNGIMEWNWEESKEQHYNYPWELDCTVYRKEDVETLIAEEEKVIKNPNYFEAIINDDNRNIKIGRKFMACNQRHGCAVVITVNRVQESYQNGFDDSMMTDIYSLDHLYHEEDNTLDIEKIAQLENHVVHVGAEYFILRKANQAYSIHNLQKKKWRNLEKKIEKLVKKSYNYLERRVYRYGLMENKLSIADMEHSIDILEQENVSFVRIGKGEIALMQGKTIAAQQYNEELEKRLKQILRLRESGLRIGIPYYYIHPQKNLNPYIEIHALSIADYRRFLFQHCPKDIDYLDSGFTQAYHIYEDYDFEGYFSRVKNLFQARDISIICGEGVLDRLQYNLLEGCKSIEYQYAPATEAYTQYKEIRRRALQIEKNRLVCVILGPTAKPLVYDLYKKGYQVWDIGHLLKDYDAYKRNVHRTEAEITQFYLPD